METIESIRKVRSALRHFLLGRRFYKALEAFDYAEKLHVGTRKDGVTPSFHHQISIANYITTLPLEDTDMELAVTLAFLHDTPEDMHVSDIELKRLFGDEVGRGALLLAKKFRGVELPKEVYFKELTTHPMATLVKGVDRLNNLSTMVGVFKFAKQRDYIAETLAHHLPMLKEARRMYPKYTLAFENIKYSINSRIEMTTLYLDTIEGIQK